MKVVKGNLPFISRYIIIFAPSKDKRKMEKIKLEQQVDCELHVLSGIMLKFYCCL